MISKLPSPIHHIGTPPIKCQGIKTKLVRFILSSIEWDPGSSGRWIEPFMGSGVVVFNLAPPRAILGDSNHHIIALYQAIQQQHITPSSVRAWLVQEGARLAKGGAEYYYEVRERFNSLAAPMDFLFLNRSCFNGVMRFNSTGGFNVPFGHKPHRFAQAYVTKIVNQVGWVAKQMRDRDWQFVAGDWRSTLAQAAPSDFVYLDPPYIGRHTDYFNAWSDAEATDLAAEARRLPCGFALSMWLENEYRKNDHLADCWSGLETRICSHYYHVGSSEDLRKPMDEALVIKPGYATADRGKQLTRRPRQEAPDLFVLPPG
jgi:DNA adenine methylase